jgi:pimeloyl-ACP methyl ester carboxylesterase
MTFLSIQRGSGPHRPTLVFLPGWGFDGAIGRYGVWPQGVEVLAPAAFCHAGLVADLRAYLADRGPARVALVGWSMGAQVAWQFAQAFPERVASLTLLAGRRHWPQAELAAIKAELAMGMATSMQGFYRTCFLGHKQLYQRFVNELEADYLARLSRVELEAGLDYLGATPLKGQAPAGVGVQVIHGRKDVVAPWPERPRITGAVELPVESGGHLLFAQPRPYLL